MHEEDKVKAFLASSDALDDMPASFSAMSAGDKLVVRAFWWGWHIEVPQKILEKIRNGTTLAEIIAGGLFAVIGAACPPIGIAGAAALFVIGAHGAIIDVVNEGKGVYLSWLWLQVIPPAPTAALPVPTPIK